MTDRERLRTLVVTRSVRIGDFTLASGARSSYYVDARRTAMTAEGQCLIGKVCLGAISESGWSATHVGGLTMGADPVAYAIAHRSWLEGSPLDAFSVRKRAKRHGTGERIEGGLPTSAACIVVEDAMTSGESALEAIEVIEQYGASVVGVLTLVDREEGARARLERAGYPLISIYSGPELLESARPAGARSP